MLCTSSAPHHAVTAETLRSAGLLHLVCIPQHSTGKWLVENSYLNGDEGNEKGRDPGSSYSVDLNMEKGYVAF